MWDFKDVAQEAVDELFAEGKLAVRLKVMGCEEFERNTFRVTFDGFAFPMVTVRLIPGHTHTKGTVACKESPLH